MIEFVSSNANSNSFFNEFVSLPINKTQWLALRNSKQKNFYYQLEIKIKQINLFLKLEREYKIKQDKVVRKYKELFEKIKAKQDERKSDQSNSINTSELDKIPRTSLMLNVIQMVREDYPLPFDKSCSQKLQEYVYTKQVYHPVHNASPLFSIDCEMCYNEDGESELVWLAIANENLECVYETFVKPRKKIKNFLTQ